MKRIGLLIALMFISSKAMAWVLADQSLSFGTGSQSVTVGSATVTQIMTKDNYITASYVINNSTWQSVCLSSFSATVAVSTTTSPRIPPNSIFHIGSYVSPYAGNLYATMCAPMGNVPATVVGATQTISVIRTK